ncbi:hypothetical protein BOX15_Mlig002721g1 [Macrostomum lignano]|uniref:CS domain-containing protein n=1 Tax=Macrostomum lignano TaxID=282301 RepID=A0A267E7T2_9PLAT|nr:hypothetical protein BOX15_Mlig002721g1 [Macrostomum lignano]
MSGDSSAAPIPPAVMWAQRKDKLYVTICLEDVQNKKLELTDKQLIFSGVGGTDRKPHAVTIDFHKEVNPDDSKQLVTDREIVMCIKKKESGPYWPRLLSDSTKRHWLKTDFNRWLDEDDSDDDMAARENNLEEMMARMGSGFGGGDDGLPLPGDDIGADEPDQDSDDEDLPDLE